MAALTNALEQTLSVFEPGGEPLSTGEVAAVLPVGRRSTYDRLDRLAERGLLSTKAVGASGRIWWRQADDAASTDRVTATDGPERVHANTESELAASTPSDPEFREAENDPAADETDDENEPGVEETEDENEPGTEETEDENDPREDTFVPSVGTFERALDATATGFAILDDDTDGEPAGPPRLAYANESFREHVALPADGSRVEDETGAEDPGGTDAVDDVLASVTLYDVDREPLPSDEHGVPIVFTTESGREPRRVLVESADGDRWLSLTTTGSNPVLVATRDVTRQVDWEAELVDAYAAAERELADFRDRAVDGYATVNDRGVVVDLDDRFAALADADADVLLGRSVQNAFDDVPAVASAVTRTLDGDVGSATTDPIPVGDEHVRVEAIRTDDGVAVYQRDVTDRVEREIELKRYASLVDALGEPVYELDDRGCFTFVNDAAVRESGFSREELVGSHVSIGMDDDAIETVGAQLASLLDDDAKDRLRVEFDVTPKDGDPYPVENRLALLTDDDGTVTGSAGILRDITERKARERELETYERIVEAVDEGIYVVDDEDRFTLVNEAFANFVGADVEDVVGEHPRDALSESAYRTAKGKVAELEASDASSIRFQEHLETKDGKSFVAEVQFSEMDLEDGETGRVGVVRDVTERVNRERRIENQRARLEALNEVNAVVRDVASAAVEGSTREDIETLVCEELAAAESYAFAWIGDVDRFDGTVRLRAEAGVENYLDGVTIATDPRDPRSAGPVGRAVTERSVQTVQDATRDPRFDPWRELVARHDFQSAAAIPITFEGTLYGVLSVHAHRTNAFTGEERLVLERIGEVVGHAFAAVERKRALTSEQLVELDYRVPNAFAALGVDAPRSGRMTFDDVVTVDEDELLVFGTVTADAVEGLRALVDAFPSWESVSILGASRVGEGSRFELAVSSSSAFEPTTAMGEYVDRATFEDGDCRFRFHVPPEVDARDVTAALRETYPETELVAKRQSSRSRASMATVRREVDASLTDRQRSTLTAAFHAGFFEWPRDVTGEELAGTLGVAPSTFSQHIRKAERKVLAAVLDAEDGIVERDPSGSESGR